MVAVTKGSFTRLYKVSRSGATCLLASKLRIIIINAIIITHTHTYIYMYYIAIIDRINYNYQAATEEAR